MPTFAVRGRTSRSGWVQEKAAVLFLAVAADRDQMRRRRGRVVAQRPGHAVVIQARQADVTQHDVGLPLPGQPKVGDLPVGPGGKGRRVRREVVVKPEARCSLMNRAPRRDRKAIRLEERFEPLAPAVSKADQSHRATDPLGGGHSRTALPRKEPAIKVAEPSFFAKARAL
jgi:hypothetical protein